jgi:3',5'-cyclic-nucleotide phosphodiesterase
MKVLFFCSLLWATSLIAAPSQPKQDAFELIVLGDSGGIQDGNLSAFLLRSLHASHYIALDAGTLVNGINVAHQQGAFAELDIKPDPLWQDTGSILREHIKGYFISHAHLDHIAGLLIASPQDSKKPIYGLASVNQMISDTYFNWQAWANFTDRGKAPQLKQYALVDLVPAQATIIKDTGLTVTAFSLSHPLESTALVIEKGNDLLVYLGDTGPDPIEKQGKLATLWQHLASLMQHKTLRGLVIEVSFDNQRPDNLLFGHLTPKWLMHELKQFSALLDSPQRLQDTKIIISHIKYSLKKGMDPKLKIKQQLEQDNSLGLDIIIATQGQRIVL